jgi:hypothetical protein
MRRPENNRSLANAGSGEVDAGHWAWMLAYMNPIRTQPDDSFVALHMSPIGP